jgi:putative transposase
MVARNGITAKTVHTPHGSVRIEQPRDRQSSFDPQIMAKHQRRFTGFDERIVAMYARGMSVRDIQAHLAELYGVEVGNDLISRVTDACSRTCASGRPARSRTSTRSCSSTR